ncbi:MAG TPA: hypothetical protein VFL95_02610 [Gemmatimonadales bacterium]|nr:hypothetical protein [Gemmatimonadales bacterium]
MASFTLRQLLVGFLLGAVLLDRGRARAVAILGTVALALGAATLRVDLGPVPLGALAPHITVASAPLSFTAGTVGLLLLGALLILAAIVVAAASRRIDDRAGAAVLAATLAALAWTAWPLVLPRVVPTITAAGLILAGALALYWIARLFLLGTLIRWLTERVLGSAPLPVERGEWRRSELILAGAVVVGGLLAIAAQHLELVLGGALLAALAGQVLLIRRGGSRVPLLPVVSGVALLLAGWLMTAIARPTGLDLSQLPQGPFSPAAETLLVLLLSVAAIPFLALWPIHRWVPGIVLAPIGGALLLRIAVPALLDGLLHWQGLLDPIALLSVAVAAALRRPRFALVGLALMGAASGAGEGASGAVWLLAACFVAGWRDWFRLPVALPPLVIRLLWLVPAWGALLVLDGLLRSQVVYAVLTCAAIAATAWACSVPRLRLAPSPLQEADQAA